MMRNFLWKKKQKRPLLRKLTYFILLQRSNNMIVYFEEVKILCRIKMDLFRMVLIGMISTEKELTKRIQSKKKQLVTKMGQANEINPWNICYGNKNSLELMNKCKLLELNIYQYSSKRLKSKF